ncbi:unnamed protein product, partial [Rotaria sp. Silwood1]
MRHGVVRTDSEVFWDPLPYGPNDNLHLCSDWPIGFLVHEILESTSNYNIAVEQLAQSPIIAPCYFTICGTSQCKTIETLITRKQTSEENRRRALSKQLLNQIEIVNEYELWKDDDEESFDYDHKFFDYSPFPDKCQNKVVAIESFYSCFIRRYNSCPIFFVGSLQNACQEAFSSRIIKEHRPVLIYIHNDKSMFTNTFCSNIFCSEIIIEYLLENYITWPWDITFQSNRNRLIEIWQEIFATQLLDIMSVIQCPIVFGVMRRSAGEKGWPLISEYEFKLLLKDDILIQTQEKLTREAFLRELIIFKEEFDHNEQLLSLNFMTKTGLCWDIILEIAKYLTLNDAVEAFSDKILFLLRKYKTK